MKDEKEKVGFVDMFTDSKYRARMILVFYLILFIVIIFWFRSLPNNTNPNKSGNIQNQNGNNSNGQNNNADKNTDKFEDNQFKLLTARNFSFEYILKIDDTQTISIGRKYLAKEKFETSTNLNDTIIEYYVDGTGIKGRPKNGETPYNNTSKPYMFIDYFDISLLGSIITASEKTDTDNILTISNEKLCDLLSFPSPSENGINTIELTIKNSYIVGIKMEYAAFSNILEKYYMTDDFRSISFELKYSDFNLIDDFNAKN